MVSIISIESAIKDGIRRIEFLWKKCGYSTRLLFGVCVLSFVLALIATGRNRPPVTPNKGFSPDTLIPHGFVLVPIRLANFQALDSILGRYGTVDLFDLPAEPGGAPVKVASGVKILRAPQSPNHFAALVPEQTAPILVSQQGSFFAVVQNPKQYGTRIEMRMQHSEVKRSRIIVEE